VVLLLILVTLLTYAFFSEKIFSHDGMGYDGAFYGNFTIYLKENIKDHTINKYYFQRLLLPFIIHHLFSLLHISLSIANVILAYSIANISFIFAGVYFFFRTSSLIKLSKSIEVIGFAALFFCFPILKLGLYYPILMDIPAFTLSIMMVYVYLKRKMALFFLLIFLGSFVYPNFIVLSVLYFFNFRKDNEVVGQEQNKLISFFNKVNFLHLIICFALPAILLYAYFTLFWQSSFENIKTQFVVNTAQMSYVCFMFLLAFFYVAWLNYFSRKNFTLQLFFKSVNSMAIILAGIVFMLIQVIINTYASKDTVPLTFMKYIFTIIYQAISNPINFIVAHVFYFGLTPLLSLFIMKDIKREIVNFGFGMILFFNVAIFFSIGSESRQLINYYPFLVFLLIYALNKYWEVSMSFSLIVSAISLTLSHFWYTINKGIIPDPKIEPNSILAFPLQRYFMFQGPWVNDTMYKIHLVVVCLLVVLFWVLVKKTGLVKRKTEIAEAAV
jgi:hypothetical protein